MAKFKVIVKWGPKKQNNSAYKITGKNLDECFKQLQKLGEWGKCAWKCPYTWADANKVATKATIKPQYIISMPTWSKKSSAPKASQKEWDRMWKKLEEHEHGHREIFLKDVEKLKKELEKVGKPGVPGSKIDEAHAKWKKATDAAQDKFDSTTGHGSKKGVHLTIPAGP